MHTSWCCVSDGREEPLQFGGAGLDVGGCRPRRAGGIEAEAKGGEKEERVEEAILGEGGATLRSRLERRKMR